MVEHIIGLVFQLPVDVKIAQSLHKIKITVMLLICLYFVFSGRLGKDNDFCGLLFMVNGFRDKIIKL